LLEKKKKKYDIMISMENNVSRDAYFLRKFLTDKPQSRRLLISQSKKEKERTETIAKPTSHWVMKLKISQEE
jgi:hypothetical protein